MRSSTTILLVEDNPADSLLIKGALTKGHAGTQIQLAVDGQEATDYLQQKGNFVNAPKPDLIILDLNLPRKDGKEVLRDIKTDPKLKAIPVVILTSSESEKDILAAYNSHANTYFSKPADLKDYYAILDEIRAYWLEQARLPSRP